MKKDLKLVDTDKEERKSVNEQTVRKREQESGRDKHTNRINWR
jgi:hypothetical protein